jgi:hypothetical protein
MTASLPASIGWSSTLRAAGLARFEAHWNHDAVAERQRLLDVAGTLAHQLVHAIAEREHGRDGKSGEGEPLLPRQDGAVDQANQTDQRGRDTEENQVELCVDHEQFEGEQHRCHHEPSPPRHRTLLVRVGPQCRAVC